MEWLDYRLAALVTKGVPERTPCHPFKSVYLFGGYLH